MADQYHETVGRFSHKFNVITGLFNLHLLWDRIDRGLPPLGRWRRDRWQETAPDFLT